MDFTLPELAAIADALTWNVAKQKWLKLAWKDFENRAGHRRRQEQAEQALEKVERMMKELGGKAL